MNSKAIPPPSPSISTGWVDLQVNGYAGVDFSGPGLTLDQVRQVVHVLLGLGTTAFCPTVITSPEAIYRRNLQVLAQAVEDPELAPHLLGIHLEGPFISPLDGARGAHSRADVLAPSISFLRQLYEWAQGHVSMLTLAPELPDSLELIHLARSLGIVVALGHHLADRETIRRACDAGASLATHLGNGIPNMLPRHPNPIWDQLAEERLRISLITDGHHLQESFLQVCWRIAGIDRLLLVSDSAPIAGFAPGEYSNLGQQVRLEENGKLWNPIGNHLVGSSCCLAQCVHYAGQVLPLSSMERQAIARTNALRVIGKGE